MPSEEECRRLEINDVKLESRVNSISERLDEVLDEVKSIKAWFMKYGTITFFLAVLGDKALPFVTKILGS